MRKLIWLLGIWLIACSSPQKGNTQTTAELSLLSPDGKTKVEFFDENGSIFYSLSHGNTKLLNKSELGLKLSSIDFSKGLKIINQPRKKIDETYEMILGKRKLNEAKANELSLQIENADKQQITIVFRAYNEGVTFRYEINEGTGSYLVENEATTFNVNPNGYAWLEPYAWWSPVYEELHERKIPIGAKSKMYKQEGWSFPALFNIEDAWMLISESDLDGTYAGGHLQNEEDNPIYKLALPSKNELYKVKSVNPTIRNFPWQSPWRTICVGNLAKVVESNLVHHIARPNKLKNADWVIPGKAAWTWLTNTSSPRDYQALAQAVDAATEMKWDYLLVDANWEKMKNGGDIQKLIEYAKTKNVGLFLWYNSGGPHNAIGDFAETEGPRNLMHEREVRRKEFEKLQSWGIKGVKVDFFGSDKQEIMQMTIDILEDATDFEILVNIHGCTFPRGWQRTYPHLVTAEAVKGNENFLGDRQFEKEAGRHMATLPFTRNVVASIDNTPIVFNQLRIPRHTTYGFEVALSVIYESGFYCFGDLPSFYTTLPDTVKNFLSSFPVTWDDTKLLAGYPGEECYLARRKGKDWYLAGINGYYDLTKTELDLSFLGEGTYEGQMISNQTKDSKKFTYETIAYPATKTLNIDLQGEDGFVIKFTAQ